VVSAVFDVHNVPYTIYRFYYTYVATYTTTILILGCSLIYDDVKCVGTRLCIHQLTAVNCRT